MAQMPPNLPRTAVLFHYFDRDESYVANLICFLALAYRRDADFFIISCATQPPDLPDLPNLRLLPVPNVNHDFGGHGIALRALGLPADYDRVVFINASVRGPFGPRGMDWLVRLTAPLSDPGIVLAGTSINILNPDTHIGRLASTAFGHPGPFPHVQTTAYALRADTLRFLLDDGFYDTCDTPMGKFDIITRYEVGLSQGLLKRGGNIACLLDLYRGLDYRGMTRNFNWAAPCGDPLYPGRYFGRSVHPEDVMFLKTGRGLLTDRELASHSYTALATRAAPELANWPALHALRTRLVTRLRG